MVIHTMVNARMVNSMERAHFFSDGYRKGRFLGWGIVSSDVRTKSILYDTKKILFLELFVTFEIVSV